MNERWKPYIRYEKETDRWIAQAVKIERESEGRMEESDQKAQVQILMDRDQLDIIARIVAYLYHDKKDEYKAMASDMRKEHIYKDLRSIDIWLNSQYQKLEKENEQPKQEKRKYI
tara:strand:- start:116 stop:460 length:345 start_codon:yes stop_codon:yes gene_type:complete